MKRFIFWNLIDIIILLGLLLGTHFRGVIYDVAYVILIFLLCATGYIHFKKITLFHFERITKEQFKLAYGAIPDSNFFLKGIFIFISCGYLLYNEAEIVALVYMSMFMIHHIIRSEV